MCFLTWEDVNLKKKVLHISAKPEYEFTPKTWEEREIEMSDRLVEALKKLPRSNDEFWGGQTPIDYQWEGSALVKPVVQHVKASKDQDFLVNKLIEVTGIPRFEVHEIPTPEPDT